MNQLVCAYMSGFINKIGKTPSVRERAVDDYSREHREEDSKSNIWQEQILAEVFSTFNEVTERLSVCQFVIDDASVSICFI